MNRGVHQSSPVQQIMRGNSGWWNNMGPPPAQIAPFLPPPSSSGTPVHPQCQQQSAWQENQEHLPESWSQLLLGGLVVGEEERQGLGTLFHFKKMEAWEEQLLYHSMAGGQIVDVKLEPSSANGFAFGRGDEEIAALRSASAWGQVLPVSSPNSCVTSLSTSMLDFSTNSNSEGKRQHMDDSSEGNRAGNGGAAASKKARVLPSAGSSHTTFKVRKEKLGDRITALHQLVSPFGKTDTASVLLEAIGYIRFLQGQIEALCSPYLGNGSGNTRRQPPPPQPPSPPPPPPLLNDASLKRRAATAEKEVEGQEGPKRDLRSRGLCLVPVSCTLHVGNDNGADYWAPSLGGGFR